MSWASPGRAERPRVRIGQRVIAAAERAAPDPRAGAVMWTYHARVDGLRPGATYGYAVTADNDQNAADPFSATFTTAPDGRAAFRFTSFGDLGAPGDGRAAAAAKAAYAVGAVEAFMPLFHLLNGDLTDVGPGQEARAAAWRDFGNNVQPSAANRPWLPAPGSHEPEPGSGDRVPAAFLSRYTLPPNGVDGLDGRWYAFRVGTALFVCLSGDDVAHGPGAGGPGRVHSGGAQTRWLQSTLAAARADASIDWIVVQLHPCACSSAPASAAPGAPAPEGGGCDLGVRREWLPLFDTYEVDLVLSGHDHGYERSFPVRGFDAGAGTDPAGGGPADTWRPHPVTTVDSGVFDTSQGTVHLVLGCGGAAGPGPGGTRAADQEAGDAGAAPRVARVFTRPGGPVPDPRGPAGTVRGAADAVEAATWSARRDTSTGYGIAVFDVRPGGAPGGQTSITVRYYHAVGADLADGEQGASADDYALFETFTLVRPRSDGRRWHQKA